MSAVLLEGDAARAIGPVRNPDMGPLFLGLNRGKRSIALDLKQPAGLSIFHRLVAQSDVLVTNVRPAAPSLAGRAKLGSPWKPHRTALHS